MKQRLLLVITLVAVISSLFAIAGCSPETPAPEETPTVAPTSTPTAEPAAGETITLKTHSWALPTHPAEMYVTWWSDEVTKRTNGRVQFEHFYNGTLAKSPEQAKAIKSGLFDLGMTIPNYDTALFPLWIVTWVPFPSAKGANCLSMQTFAQLPEMVAEATAANMKYLFNAGGQTLGMIILSKKPATTLEDLKGLRVRETKADVAQMWQSVGMNCINMPPADQFDALSKGTLDAVASPVLSLDSWGIQEVAKYLLMLPVQGASGLNVMMNLDSWNSLPPDVQETMMEVSADVPQMSLTGIDKDLEAIENWKTQGVQVIEFTQEEMDRFYEGANPIIEKWIADTEAKGLPGRKVYEAWREIVAQTQ